MSIRSGLVLAAAVAGADAAAQPANMDPQCAAAYRSYSAEKEPKAFARGETQWCGWWQRSPEARTMAQIRARAIEQCTKFGGTSCKVIEFKE
jgi:hypothetical protein